MPDSNNQMTLSLDIEQRLVNLGVQYTPGSSLSKTVRREAKRRYLASLPSNELKAVTGFTQWPPLIQNGDKSLRDATSAELNDILDNFRMVKPIKELSDAMFKDVRDISKEAITKQIEHGYTVEATRVNTKGWTYYVAKPPTSAEQLRARRSSAISITAEVLSSLPAGPTKDELFKKLADAKVDLVSIKAKADKKAEEEAKQLAQKAQAEAMAKSTAAAMEKAKQQVEADKAARLQSVKK